MIIKHKLDDAVKYLSAVNRSIAALNSIQKELWLNSECKMC